MPQITTSDDVPIYFEEHGAGDPLVLVMGLGADGPVLYVVEHVAHR